MIQLPTGFIVYPFNNVKGLFTFSAKWQKTLEVQAIKGNS
jgi:hypothetical protein